MDLITSASPARAPALIGLRRKTVWHPSAVDQAVYYGLRQCVGMGQAVPLFCNGEPIMLVQGEAGSNRVRFKPITWKQFCGFNNYAEITAAITAGRYYEAFFYRDNSGHALATRWYDLWNLTGIPGGDPFTGTADTALQVNTTNYPQNVLGLGATPSTGTKHLVGWTMHVSGGIAATNINGFLYDRVLNYNNGAISNATRTMTNSAAAQRYASAGEPGLQIMGTCQYSNLGATPSNLTGMNYVDQDGNAAAIVTTDTLSWETSAIGGGITVAVSVVVPFDTTSLQTWGPYLPLAAGDTGARSITDYISSANNTGAINFALCKPLGAITSTANGSTVRADLANIMGACERLYDTAALAFVMCRNTSTTFNPTGTIQVAWG